MLYSAKGYVHSERSQVAPPALTRKRGKTCRFLGPLVGRVDGLAQTLLGVRTPVAAIQLQKHRSVRQRQVGLEDQDIEFLCCFVELINNLLVRQRMNLPVAQQLFQ